MNDLKVSTAARLAGIAESTVFLLENGSAALLTAGEVARISGKLAGSGEAVSLNGITLEQIAAAREVALAATQGPWEWGSSPCPDNETAKRICAENIDATKEPIGKFFEVFTPDGRRTSLVGNGPTSEANARHIAYFAPNNVLVMLDVLASAIAAARQSAGQERGEAVALAEVTEAGALEPTIQGVMSLRPGMKLYAAPTDAQSRIAELEAQLRAVADNHEAAISALEDTMREVCGDNASLRAERDKYYQQVINVGAVAINSIPQEHYDNLQQQLTERTEQVERMREALADAATDLDCASKDELGGNSGYETVIARYKALAAEKEQM